MNAGELKALRGAVGLRLEEKGEFKRLKEAMTSLQRKVPNLEKKIRVIFKNAGLDDDAQGLEDSSVAFTAKLSQQTLFKTDETLIFDDILTNEGDAFHPGTGQFIAPVHGTYLFSVTVRAQYHKQVSAALVSKERTLVRLSSGYGGIDRAASSITIVITLKRDDVVSVKHVSEKSGAYHGSGFTSFSGLLLD